MAEAARAHLLKAIKDLLRTGANSDLIITCHNETFKVHKSIICAQSDFLDKAVAFGGQETETGKIDLPEDDPAVVKLLVQYLYEAEYDPYLPSNDEGGAVTGPRPRHNSNGFSYTYEFPHKCNDDKRGGHYCRDYSYPRHICPHHRCGQDCRINCVGFTCYKCLPASPIEGSSSQLLRHTKLYEIADKYGVSGLKNLCEEKFKRACQGFWNDDNFTVAANYAFSTTPDDDRGLRDIVSKTIANHMELLHKPEVEALMTEFNGLAFGVLKAKAIEAKWI